MKIGEEVTFKNDFKIETMLSKTVLQVKENDKALVTKNGLKILTGEAKGKITGFAEDDKVYGVDYRNIAKMIFNRIDVLFGLEEYWDYEGIKESEVIDEIEDVLMDIL